MIFNAASVVAGFLALFRVALAVAVIGRSALALRALRRARTVGEQDAAEVLALRPALPAMALYALAVASWPLLVEVLSSYVPMWASVMCIDGVTRIGTGTIGPARHLPWLLDVVFAAKPALALIGGAWLVAHLVRRGAEARPGMLGPLLLLAIGGVALLDGVAEVAYLVIPKREETLSAGCCVVTSIMTVETESSWLESFVTGVSPGVAVGARVATVLLLAGVLIPSARGRPGRAPVGGALSVSQTIVAAAVAILAQHVVLAVASPRFTGISTHRCGWCVVEHSPLGGVAVFALSCAVAATLLTALASVLERRARTAARISGLTARVALGLLLLGASLAGLACV